MRHTREFLARVLPWPGEDDGYVNIHWRSYGQNGKQYWGGRAAKTVDEAVRLLNWAQRQEGILDLYCCMSMQSKAEPKVSKLGNKYLNAIRSQQNAVALRSLYLDIDVKEGAYTTTQDAVVALKELIAALSLPMPTAVVSSGSGGVHVHWALAEPILRADWQPLADALARAASQHGLHFDQQCTIDSARILRIPGTHNYKLDPPADVALMALGEYVELDELRSSLGPYMVAKSEILLPARVSSPVTVNDDLAAGVTGSAPVPSIDTVALTCGFVRTALDTGGASYSNPLWMLTTYLAAFTVEGREAAHRMAQGHPTYEVSATDALYDRMLSYKEQSDSGWPRCEKIELSGCRDCASCPLRSQNKSPFHFALPKAANDAPVDLMPSGYHRAQDGRVFRMVPDETGGVTAREVMPYPVMDGWLQEDPWVLHFTSVVASGRRKKIEVPLEAVATKDSVLKALARHGFTLSENAGKAVREFIVAWVQKLQSIKEAVVSSTPFGWTSAANGKIEGFTYAGKVYGNGFERPAALPDPSLAMLYSPKGEPGPWIAASRIITDQRRPGLDAILAASFGAPLVRFTGQTGVMMNTYSPESGIGKTTTMRVAQAVWGDPVRSMQSLNDTPNSVINKIGELRALPLFWDELKTEADTNRFVVMAFQITQGKERSRLKHDITQRMPGTWQTMLVSASNDSIIDPIVRATRSTTAGMYRCFEYAVTKGIDGQIETGVVSRAVGLLNDNFGHAGVEYSKFLGEQHERIAREVAQIQDDITREVNAGNDERFWIAVVAVVMAGARYANELGLTEIDEAALRVHMLEVLTKMRDEVRSTPTDMSNTISVSNVLAQFLKTMRARHTLVTDRVHVGRGKPSTKNPIKVLNDVSKLDTIHVHVGRDSGLMRISSTYFSDWMAEHGYSRHAFTRALKEEFGVHETYGRIGSGTDFSSPTEYILEINLFEPKLKQLLGDFEDERDAQTLESGEGVPVDGPAGGTDVS